MNRRIWRIVSAVALATGLGASNGYAQQAGRDFGGGDPNGAAIGEGCCRVRVPGHPQPPLPAARRGSENTNDNLPGYIRDPATVPARWTWFAEAARVFDNLYFVGGRLHSSWALTTSEGIFLFDTIYPYNSEELIIGAMCNLGLDPADIRYLFVSHAHGDHIGGAQVLQERYRPRVVMGGPDWDLVERYPNRYRTMAPSRDIVAIDGMAFTLGGTTVRVRETPGHTPGTLSFTFNVLDGGLPLNVVYTGGTAFNFHNDTPDPGIRNFQTYIESQRHLAAQAEATGATVLLSNHSEFDNALNRNRMLAGRGDRPHPYELGEDWVQRYFQVTEGCARAAQIGLEREAEDAALP